MGRCQSMSDGKCTVLTYTRAAAYVVVGSESSFRSAALDRRSECDEECAASSACEGPFRERERGRNDHRAVGHYRRERR